MSGTPGSQDARASRRRLAVQLLSYLAEIPEDRWCANGLSDGHGRFCALGHLGATTSFLFEYPERGAARDLKRLLCAPYINDGRDPRYQQPHPKARIVNALCDIIEGSEA